MDKIDRTLDWQAFLQSRIANLKSKLVSGCNPTGMTRFELATFRSTGDCSRPTELHPQMAVFSFQGSGAVPVWAYITFVVYILQNCQGVDETFFDWGWKRLKIGVSLALVVDVLALPVPCS